MTRTCLCLLLAVGCGGSADPGHPDAADAADPNPDGAPGVDASLYQALPFSGGSDAPVVASAQYRCRVLEDNGLVELELIITDPQGPGDLVQFANDHGGMYTTDPPSGPETSIGFTVKAAGVQWDSTWDGNPESWGAVFTARTIGFDVYDQICSAATWPADVLVVDNNGHVTSGLVRATLVAPPN